MRTIDSLCEEIHLIKHGKSRLESNLIFLHRKRNSPGRILKFPEVTPKQVPCWVKFLELESGSRVRSSDSQNLKQGQQG